MMKFDCGKPDGKSDIIDRNLRSMAMILHSGIRSLGLMLRGFVGFSNIIIR